MFGDICFNGAALFQVRKEESKRGDMDWDYEASMGPHFFKCGKCIREEGHCLSFNASMGPHFFKCGKEFERFFGFRPTKCFNGAALFQVRKGPQVAPSGLDKFCFNGAALFQVRKD